MRMNADVSELHAIPIGTGFFTKGVGTKYSPIPTLAMYTFRCFFVRIHSMGKFETSLKVCENFETYDID